MEAQDDTNKDTFNETGENDGNNPMHQAYSDEINQYGSFAANNPQNRDREEEEKNNQEMETRLDQFVNN